MPDTVNRWILRQKYPPEDYSAPLIAAWLTEAEIQALLTACADLHPPGGLRGASCATIFGLIAATGLRISEATALTRSDVDLKRGLLHIRHAKFDKSRWVPMHPTTTSALQRYGNGVILTPLPPPPRRSSFSTMAGALRPVAWNILSGYCVSV